MKSKEELTELKEEPEIEAENPQKLTDEELEQVTGGLDGKKIEQVKAGFKWAEAIQGFCL